MDKPKACVLVGYGINCEHETAHALSVAGAACDFVHFKELEANGAMLEDYQMFILPGGFSFGDDIQSGRVLANKFKFKLRAPLQKFIDSGKPVLGICNGFQTLVQLGAIPGWDSWGARPFTLMANRLGKFEDRWVRLRTERSACKFAQNMEFLTLPVRHGEGQVAFTTQAAMDKLLEKEQVVFRYASRNDGLKADSYPDNPNGSADAIAGICNEEGNVLGMMPHPECHIRYLQNPLWTANPPRAEPEGQSFMQKVASLFSSKKPENEIADPGQCSPFFENFVGYAKKYI